MVTRELPFFLNSSFSCDRTLPIHRCNQYQPLSNQRIHSIRHSLRQSIDQSTKKPTPPPSSSLPPSLTHSLTHSLTRSLAQSLARSLNQSSTPWRGGCDGERPLRASAGRSRCCWRAGSTAAPAAAPRTHLSPPSSRPSPPPRHGGAPHRSSTAADDGDGNGDGGANSRESQ